MWLNVPSDASRVGKRNTNKECKETSQDAPNTSRVGSVARHASSLEVQRRQVSETEDEDGRPVEEDCVREGRQRSRIRHLTIVLAQVTKRIGSTIVAVTSTPIVERGTPLVDVVATSVALGTSRSIVHVTGSTVTEGIRVNVDCKCVREYSTKLDSTMTTDDTYMETQSTEAGPRVRWQSSRRP